LNQPAKKQGGFFKIWVLGGKLAVGVQCPDLEMEPASPVIFPGDFIDAIRLCQQLESCPTCHSNSCYNNKQGSLG
jgi:hypothetical protein